MFTVHMPADKSLPKLPASQVPIDPAQNPFKKRTILPRLPCLAEVNTLTELYSIPKHNELLPPIFMFSTVPILFGMMFSDFGHGLMLLAACVALKLSPIFYFMAFMSIYCGVIYN
jgi:vacuolar-type H+-ATPase subunit I/STV1